MSEQKSLILQLAETYERYRLARHGMTTDNAPRQPSRLGRFLRWLVPNGGTILLVLVLILTQQVWARPARNVLNVPGPSATTVNYQGRLADPAGNPLDGTYGMSFALFATSTGGSPVWGPENHTAVPVSSGLFSIGLGSQTAGGIPTTTWDGDRYLEITVGGETLSPRELIRSVPIAGMALTVPEGAIGTAQVADGAISPGKLSFSPSRFVPVQPEGNVLYLTGQSNVDWTDFDLSAWVTTRTYAVALELGANDAAANTVDFLVRRKGYTGPDWGPLVKAANGTPTYNDVIVGCNDLQMIQYKIITSGAGTATVRFRVTGYWETISP